MEKPHSGQRGRPARKQMKTATEDKSCQTELELRGCCESGKGVSVSVGVGTTSPGTDPKTAVLFMEPGDPPLLQQQLQTSKSGIQQIIECFRSGTSQLKHLLLKEVDTIFECKLCRSLFRGLPNLITHKEFYCFRREPDAADPSAEDRQSQAIRDLLEAIYPRKDKPEYVVQLDPIETNQNAVFQRIATEDNASLHEEQSSTHEPAPEDPDAEEQPANVSEGEESKPAAEEVPGKATQKEADPEVEEEVTEELMQPVRVEEEDEAEANGDEDYKVSCCLCGKDFNSHRSVRRHCRKMHKSKIDELCKFTETHTVPISLFSTVRGRPSRCSATSVGRECPMCSKSFATKANVRRHFDEVHRGLRRDTITPDIATKPGQPLSLEPPHVARKKKSLARAQYNLVTCKCLMCRRKYSSQLMLGRHLRIVHKINVLENGSASTHGNLSSAVTTPARSEQYRKGAPASKVKRPHKALKLSVGFDFKLLYCRLCKRQFSSKQNLAKHIDMHTDGDKIYIKFYSCPICNYESRRKRDVIRHITVVHKKSSRYLAKIIPNLENKAIKKPAESILNTARKRGPVKEEVNGRHEPLMGSAASLKPEPPVASPTKRKLEAPVGSPANRKQEPNTGSPLTRRQEALEASTEVKVTKNFSLHTCEVCGRAFAKQFFLEKHMITHKRATLVSADGKRKKGRSTRSKTSEWYV